jgi:hypothetical protein
MSINSADQWEDIKLNLLFHRVRKTIKEERKNVIIHDTTGNVSTFYAYNAHGYFFGGEYVGCQSHLLEFNKHIMKVHAKTETKNEAF